MSQLSGSHVDCFRKAERYMKTDHDKANFCDAASPLPEPTCVHPHALASVYHISPFDS